jgi:hypothetical protein
LTGVVQVLTTLDTWKHIEMYCTGVDVGIGVDRRREGRGAETLLVVWRREL